MADDYRKWRRGGAVPLSGSGTGSGRFGGRVSPAAIRIKAGAFFTPDERAPHRGPMSWRRGTNSSAASPVARSSGRTNLTSPTGHELTRRSTPAPVAVAVELQQPASTATYTTATAAAASFSSSGRGASGANPTGRTAKLNLRVSAQPAAPVDTVEATAGGLRSQDKPWTPHSLMRKTKTTTAAAAAAAATAAAVSSTTATDATTPPATSQNGACRFGTRSGASTPARAPTHKTSRPKVGSAKPKAKPMASGGVGGGRCLFGNASARQDPSLLNRNAAALQLGVGRRIGGPSCRRRTHSRTLL